MSRARSKHSGPLTIERLLDLLAEADLLDATQVEEIRTKADHQQRMIRHRRAQAGEDETATVSPTDVVVAFHIPTSDGALLDEGRILRAVAAAAGARFVDIDPLKIDGNVVSSVIAQAYARRNAALPLGFEGEKLLLAVDDPWARDVRVTMEARVGRPVELVVARRSEILRVLDDVFEFRASVRGAAAEIGEGGTDLGNLEQLVRIGTAGRAVEGDDRNVVRAVDYLFDYALEQGASDIHIEPKRERTLVRLRIDGVLHTAHELPKVVHNAITSRIKTLGRLDIAEKRRPQDGRVKLKHRDTEVEVRVSAMPTAFGEKLVMRLFDPDVLLQEIDQLGFFGNELAVFQAAIARPTGLVLVTGPTGSGKTTTLYSALRSIASPTVNVSTIEDPIEMIVEDFNQTAVHNRIGLTFGAALRTLLRQDPDIMMVGEIRDPETAQNALQAAMTGHLVLSTLHTNDAPGAVTRMADLEAPAYLLASTLTAVVAQRLLRRVCLACREETELDADQARALGVELRRGERFPVWRGRGCAVCRNTGLKGRTGIYEVMAVGDKLRRLIIDGADATEIGKQAHRDGMLTLREVALKKLALGLTSFDEVLRMTAEQTS